jgi:hypothetical protein
MGNLWFLSALIGESDGSEESNRLDRLMAGVIITVVVMGIALLFFYA